MNPIDFGLWFCGAFLAVAMLSSLQGLAARRGSRTGVHLPPGHPDWHTTPLSAEERARLADLERRAA